MPKVSHWLYEQTLDRNCEESHQDKVASAASFTLIEAGLCSFSPLCRTSSSCRDLLPEIPSSTISNTSTKQSWSRKEKQEAESWGVYLEVARLPVVCMLLVEVWFYPPPKKSIPLKQATYLRGYLYWSFQTYLLIQHVGVLGEPHTQKLEGGYNHGVEVSGLKGSWTATLVHDVPAYRADGTFTVWRVHSNFYLVRTCIYTTTVQGNVLNRQKSSSFHAHTDVVGFYALGLLKRHIWILVILNRRDSIVRTSNINVPLASPLATHLHSFMQIFTFYSQILSILQTLLLLN